MLANIPAMHAYFSSIYGTYPPDAIGAIVDRAGFVNTADFIAAAERASGQDLGSFFDVWLFQPGKPTTW